jgi:ABC-type bacteriocin/lantibiotic exporter with double-glycine peptidase domain
MKPVVQEEITGCGIASVAALAGVSYGEAKAVANRLGIYAADKNLWSDTRYVRTLLKHYGIAARRDETAFRSWDALPDLALLAIKWHLEDGKPFWHWVVYCRGPAGPVVLDPKRGLKANTRRDFGRIKPKWFIPVRHAGGIR